MEELTPQFEATPAPPPPLAAEPAAHEQVLVNPDTAVVIPVEDHSEETAVEVQVQQAPPVVAEALQSVSDTQSSTAPTPPANLEKGVQPPADVAHFEQVVHAAAHTTAEEPLEQLSQFVTAGLPSADASH